MSFPFGPAEKAVLGLGYTRNATSVQLHHCSACGEDAVSTGERTPVGIITPPPQMTVTTSVGECLLPT